MGCGGFTPFCHRSKKWLQYLIIFLNISNSCMFFYKYVFAFKLSFLLWLHNHENTKKHTENTFVLKLPRVQRMRNSRFRVSICLKYHICSSYLRGTKMGMLLFFEFWKMASLFVDSYVSISELKSRNTVANKDLEYVTSILSLNLVWRSDSYFKFICSSSFNFNRVKWCTEYKKWNDCV